MGCNTSSTISNPSTPQGLDPISNYDGRRQDDSIFSQKNMAADDTVIEKLTSANDNLDLQLIIDPESFNSSFIKQRKQTIDNRFYRTTIDSWQPKSLQQLADSVKELTKGKPSVERHWIIFYWIAKNIEYDVVSYFAKDYKDQTAEGVFRTRKGVCAGYANLYKYLCNEIQAPCGVIPGYSKGYGFEYGKEAPERVDHAWNAVEIDQHWYLLDSTWGAGHLNDKNAFERKLDDYYFLTRPDELIYHHFPEKTKWQLLKTPIKLDQFMEMPHLRPGYYDYQIELISPRHQVQIPLLPGKSYAFVLLRAPSDVYLMSDLKLNEKDIEGTHYIMYDKRKQCYRCYFAPPSTGNFKITIYARRGDSDLGEYKAVLEFILDVKQSLNNIISFPRIWKIFSDSGLEIVHPTNTHLIKLGNGNDEAQILIRTPDNIELLGKLKNEKNEDIVDGDHLSYDKQKKIWCCKFAPDRPGIFEALILAKKKTDPGHFTSAVSFKINAKQMSTTPVSYPQTWPLLNELGLKIIAPQNSANAVWPANGTYAEVLIQAPQDVQISGHIQLNNVIVENGSLAQYDSRKKVWQLLYAPERNGLHELYVFAKRVQNAQSPANAVVKFNLNVTKIGRPMKFPMTYTLFQTKKCQIISPLDGVLKKGANVSINCIVPGAIDVSVAVDGKLLESGGYSNSVFKRDVTAGSKDLLICAQYNQKTGFDGLIQYTVR